jgi:glycosyltransferase involved in cell wall biosynthesis
LKPSAGSVSAPSSGELAFVSERLTPWQRITPTLDVFIDLSASAIAGSTLRRVVAEWARAESLGAIARRVTGVVAAGTLPVDSLQLPSEHWTLAECEAPTARLNAALAAAGRDEVPLLVLFGPVDVNCEAIGILRQCLERDPMFGFAVPRIGCVDRCCFARLSRHGLGASEWLPRRILADLPDQELSVETAAPCMLVGPRISGNFGPLDVRFDGVAAAVVHYVATARRCGFRTVLSNRAVVGIDSVPCDTVAVRPLSDVSARDHVLLHRLVPDIDRAWEESRGGSRERFERLCTASIDATKTTPRPSLLLDVRNVTPTYNGTTQAILGITNALKEHQPKWDVALLASVDGAVFHDLKRVYAGWPVHTTLPDRPFTAALRPSQPWHIQEMVDLHSVSLFNAYLLLDTIAWDIAYAAPPHLEGTWRFLADHADAFLFDSHFTRQRFVERFPSAGSVPGRVMHLSFDPNEYARADVRNTAGGDEFILVIGNNLDHKDVRRTVEALASAFPFRHIRALGPADVVSPFVRAQHSGDLPESEIHRLYAGAQFVVFPSFYEGFGFPILTALAYGRTVLARRSALLEEVAAQCDGRGRLVAFDRREELVELLGRLVHGEPVLEHPLGLGLANGRPRTWADAAHDALDFLESRVREPSRRRWIARESAVRILTAYRT